MHPNPKAMGDEDDFVNICINETIRIYKAGGRLLCYCKLGTSMKIKLLS